MKVLYALGVSVLVLLLGSPASAATPAAAAPAGAADEASASGLVPYQAFARSAEGQHGLFTVWHKDGSVALELRPDQFDKDFVESAVPINGLGGYFVTSGQTDFQEARILRFVRNGKQVALVWPHTRFLAQPNSALANAVHASTADSVIAVAKVLSVDSTTGNVVFDVSGLLGDVMNLSDALNQAIADPQNPATNYRLDPQRTYFGPSKAFPNNVLIEADQTFVSSKPVIIDTVTDPRSVQIKVHYNIAELPVNPAYMPRLMDDRVGFWDNGHVDFSRDYKRDNRVHYILRWDIQPSDPAARISDAKQPVVYYLSNTIPLQYRKPIREALLTWNKAFAAIGISHAVEVRDQPDDPNWDPDDIRYNVVRWLTESNSGGFAEAQVLYNPYTGQIFRSAIVIDSDLMRSGKLQYLDMTQPESASAYRPGHFTDPGFARGEAEQYQFGLTALSLMNGMDADRIPSSYADDFLKSIVLHESGHDFGLMHNFISSEVYTAKQLQSKAFTSVHGITSTVMEYTPLNLWPKGTPNGAYFQTVLGPYDYHVIRWGYGRIPNARTPDAELPALNALASVWEDPRYRLASDEDNSWAGGHAIDPRVNTYDLTNDNLAWCSTQMGMVRRLMGSLESRYPQHGQAYEEERAAFSRLANRYATCSRIVSHYIGGEYLSRSHRGDANSRPGLSEVPIAQQKRAFGILNRYLFSANAFNVPSSLVNKLVYSENESDWGYNPTPQHGVSVSAIAAAQQNAVIANFFSPLMLARLDEMPLKYGHATTMNMSDLFAWMQQSVYGDLAAPKGSIPLLRRNLQRNYELVLAHLATAPPKGTPTDAQAVARHELGTLNGSIGAALRNPRLDLVTRAHLEALRADSQRALDLRNMAPVGT